MQLDRTCHLKYAAQVELSSGKLRIASILARAAAARDLFAAAAVAPSQGLARCAHVTVVCYAGGVDMRYRW